MENYSLNSTYSILIKVGVTLFFRYLQIGFKINNTHNIALYENIYDIIIFKINDIISKYDVEYEPNSITIITKYINVPLISKNKNIELMNNHKYVFKNSGIKRFYSSNYLPFSLKKEEYGFYWKIN